MTTEWISGIEHRLQHITTLIEQLPVAPGGPGMAETKQLLSTIGSCLRDVETGLFENRPSAKLLGALAGCRKSVREASGILDEARSAAADSYRQAAGADKLAFERLTPAEQAASNPEAHRYKLTFAALRQCLDDLDQITSEMLTLEGRIEHDHWVRQRIAMGDESKIEPVGEPAGRSS